jgi:hypothetical protein
VEFGDAIRPMVNEAIDRLIASRRAEHGIDEYLAGQCKRRFLEWLNSGISDLFYDLKKLKREAHADKLDQIGRTRFTEACEVLGVTLAFHQILKARVAFGKPIGPAEAKKLRTLVRTRHHERSYDLHPDRFAGNREQSERERAEYDAVQEARAVLENYIQQMEQPHERIAKHA